MGIKAKILKELQKKPRRLKELKAKLGNDKKVARAVDELVERNKVVCLSLIHISEPTRLSD